MSRNGRAAAPPGRANTCRPNRRRVLVTLGLVTVGVAAACASGSAASPSIPTAYVVNGANVANPNATVAVVDLATAKVRSPLQVGTLPGAVAVTPDGRDALVAVKGQDQLVDVDVATGRIVGTAGVGVEPDAVAVTPNGDLALVANLDDGTVTPVALPSLRAGRPVPVGKQPTAVAVSPDGRTAFVANFGDGSITPVDLSSLTPEAAIPAGQEPVAVFVSPLGGPGGTVLVADLETSSLTPIPLATRTPGTAIPVAGDPTGIAGWPGSPTVYVSGGQAVTPVDVLTGRAGAAVALDTPAEALALAAAGREAWVCGLDGDLLRVDLTAGKVVGRIAVGGQPSAIAIANPGGANGA